MENIKQIALGSQGLHVPMIGLGCMGMTGFEDADMYGPADEQEAIATIHRSLELGGNFLDTADLYGPFRNEQLIAKAIRGDFLLLQLEIRNPLTRVVEKGLKKISA